MNKLTQLRQLIREELMKEIRVSNMARGQLYGGSGPLYDAVVKALNLKKEILDLIGEPDFDNKHNVLFFPKMKKEFNEPGYFATWTKPNQNITVNGETLSSTEWEEMKSTTPDTRGREFYIIGAD